MQKIGIENENVIRIVTDALGILASLSFLGPCWLEHGGFVPLLVASLFVLLFSFAIVAELNERIFYDDTHFEVRSFGHTEKINYSDIVKIKREYIRIKTGRPSGGHWRYSVCIKTNGSEQKIIVPFPQLIHNPHLQDLFSRIRDVNGEVQWNVPLDKS